MKTVRGIAVVLLASLLASVLHAQSTTPARQQLATAESVYVLIRTVKDRIDILEYRSPTPGGADSIVTLVPAYRELRDQFIPLLRIDSLGLADATDRLALAAMQRALVTELRPAAAPEAADTGAPDCGYDPRVLLKTGGESALTSRIYGCFGWAARNLQAGPERLTRLTLLSRLAEEPDVSRRRALFLALAPAWTAVDGGPVSPYRTLLRQRAARWTAGRLPYQRSALQTGIPADTIVAWLEAALEQWRRATAGGPIEPWDLYYTMGAAGRALNSRAPRDSLLGLNRRYYRDLGADPDSLGIHYDVLPRPGKGPVAFTSIGRRAGQGIRPESWVFATYPEGGFDNLEELLHETGHGIHLAAIETRPALTDWPRSDIFTEAIADVAALEVYEPGWQLKYLGDSAALAPSLRQKYFGIMMDMAWALFEIRLEQQPGADPNRLWAGLTSHYFHLVPHPELSWWAMRGQLIEETGYMLNYALGAIMVADIRATIRARHGCYTTGDLTFYPFLQQSVYRFGLERPARRVVRDFLGRDPLPGALLNDLSRIRGR